jgi:iron complex outermembrane receptor protein
VQHSCRLIVGLLVLSLLTPIWASGQSPDASGSSTALQEIVVTAEKRASTVQDTPISITAITGQQLERQGIADVARLVGQTPGISIESEGPGRTQFDMRGLSSAGGSSPTVGYYLGDIPVTPPTSQLSASGKVQIDPDLYDLARVEVLRGPQGTLYGAGSMGGTIRLIPNEPDLHSFSASAEVGLSGTKHGGLNDSEKGMLNLPLSEGTVALRLVATEKYDSGFIDRIVLKNFPFPNANGTRGDVAAAPVEKIYKGVNDVRTQGVRASLLIQPSEAFTLLPSVFFQKLDTGGVGAYDQPPGTLAHYQPFDVSENYTQTFTIYSLRAQYDFDALTLQSITSGSQQRNAVKEDDAENLFAAFAPFGVILYPTNNKSTESHRAHQFNEEIRVSSRGSGPLQWIVGGFYSKYTDVMRYDDSSQDYVPLFGTSNLVLDYEPDRLDQQAVFGEVNYQFVPEWKATVGARYFHYHFAFLQDISGLSTAPGVSSGAISASGVNPKVTLTYTPNKNLLFYGTAAQGFRPGGPNLPIPTNNVIDCTPALHQVGLSAEPQSFSQDKVWNYEIGEKARLADGRVTLNGDVFYIDWQKIQQQVSLACGYYFTANAGSAVSKGAELELDAKLASSLTLSQSLAYDRAQLTELSLPVNSPLGQQLPDVPKWTFSTTLDYTKPLAQGLTLDALVTNRFVGREYDYNGLPAAFTQKPSYDIVDARIGVLRNHWSAYLFADNAFNRRAVLGINRAETQNDVFTARLIPNRPRTIGLVVRYDF